MQSCEARREEIKPEEIVKEEANKTIFELWQNSSWTEKPKILLENYEEKMPEITFTRLGRPIRPNVQKDMMYYK